MAARKHPPVKLTVISATSHQLYSGMVPGYLSGRYTEEEISVELAPLIERSGGTLVAERAVAVDTRGQDVTLESGGRIGYDLVSFNVGSRTAGERTRGVAEHAAVVKPMHHAVELRRRIAELAAKPVARVGDEIIGRRAVVVGAGAAGVEVACAIATALDRERPRAVDEDSVTLLDEGERILPGYSSRFHDLARTAVEHRGIEIRTRTRVTTVGADQVSIEALGRAGSLPSDLTVWLTGAAAPPLFTDGEGIGLPRDERGFLLVDESLRSPADPRVFGAGDCVTPAHDLETPKAGVYAVREAPVLWQSLLATLGARREAPRYEPQASFLSILNTGDGKALLRWKGFVSHSHWAWALKDRIDRRFMAKYQ